MAITINGSGITSSEIADGTITNADINSSAAIAGTKVDGSFGKVLQVVHSNLTTQMTSSSTSYVDTGLTATITPSSSDSKILIVCNLTVTISGDNNAYLQALRGSTVINSGSGGTNNAWAVVNGNSTAFRYSSAQQSFNYLDSPSTTSATTYKIQAKSGDGSYTFGINRRLIDTAFGMTSNITLMEIAG